jgi:hypothetical protein
MSTSSSVRAFTYALAALLPCLAVACGDGTDETVTMDTAALTCQPGTLRVAGAIDGMSVDVTQAADTGGFSQDDGGDFGSINNTEDAAGTLTDLHVTWARGVDVGASTSATATLKIPTGPFPHDVFCAGKDTTVRSVPDAEGGGLQFRLSTLSSGAGCATARQGTLHACWRP